MKNGEESRKALKDLRDTIAGFKRPVNVLILDDSREDRLLFERTLMLAELPLEVHHAETMNDALGHLARVKFDLIFVDLKLGAGRSGLDILKHTDAPCIVLTGLDDNSEMVNDAVKAGAAVVRKPLSPQHFQLVNRLIGAMRHATT